MGMVFSNFLHFPNLWVWYLWIYGYDFQKFSGLVGILFRNSSGLMGSSTL